MFRDLQHEAEREVRYRKRVYQRLGMTPEHKRRIAMMEDIAAHFKTLADKREPDLFGQRS
jgi:hypothetical protein